MMFLDPKSTLYTCVKESCEDCKAANKLVCHFNGAQLFRFLLINFPLFIIAGYVIYRFNHVLLLPWVIFIFSYFGLMEIRVMCSHCPHYAEPGLKALKCWANYGSPKLWKYRPGPTSITEKIVFISGFLIMLLPPLIFLIIQRNFVFASIYLVLLVGWKIGLRVSFCKKCINFACLFNAVGSDTRDSFFANNPVVRNAWKK